MVKGGKRYRPPHSYWARVVSGKEGMLPQASVPDVVARGGRGSPLAVSLKKIDNG